MIRKKSAISRPRSTLIVAGLASMTLVLAACGGGSTDSGTSSDGGGGGDSTEVRNAGVIVHAENGEPQSLDPARAEQGEKGERVIDNVYERLVDVGREGPDLIPSLATEVPTLENGLVSEDRLTYTFPLREGVVFHDGTDFTADDVVYSWERIITMNLPEGQAAAIVDSVESMRAVDDFTFEVTIVEPDASFLYSVVLNTVASVVSPEAVTANGGIEADTPSEWMDANMVGTGPYVFGEWKRGESLTMIVNQDYWGENAKSDVRWDVTPEESSRVLALRAGDADIIDISPSNVGDVADVDGVTIFEGGLLLEPIHLGFNMLSDDLPASDTIPTDFFVDKRIRQAFSYAFDYDTYINSFLDGYGARYTAYIPQGVFGYDENAPIYEYDLEKAAELMKQTSYWEDGFVVSVLVQAGEPEFEGVGLLMKDGIELLNPKFRVNVVSQAETQFDDNLGADPVPFALWVKNADPGADPHQFFDPHQHPDGDWGSKHGMRDAYEDPDRIADLIDAGKATVDPADRLEIYSELQQLLYEDPMWVYAAQEGLAYPYRSWLEGFTVNPLWRGPHYEYYTKSNG
ncbi:ABC transporter substrate-binding protein [Aquiluna sp.]|nr:ABC transporter substrate-binding protein [Aquiluna sp.]MDA9099599.1 ABC transporter substrate-binding protein [Aquiluna sp.]